MRTYDAGGFFLFCLQAALANPATSLALASAAAALREARQQASGLSSDDQASVFDKVMHQQPRELEQLYSNILDHTPHGTHCYSTTQTPGDPRAAARPGAPV